MALSKKVKIALGVGAAAVVALFVFGRKSSNKTTPAGTNLVDAAGTAWALNRSDFYAPYGYMITANGAATGGRAVDLTIVNGTIVATNGQGVRYTWANSTWQQI